MKRITVVVADTSGIDLNALMAAAVEFNIETLNETKVEEPRKSIRHYSRYGKDGKSVMQTIMSHFSPSGVFAVNIAAKWLMANGFGETSYSSALSRLQQDGYVERVNKGTFKFLKPMEGMPS